MTSKKIKNILVLDTSTERSIFGIVQENSILNQEILPYGHQNSQTLIPLLEVKLKKLNLKILDFDLIVAAIGPGSYTGIRVGASIAKTFAFACKIPLVGVSTLNGFIPSQNGPYLVLIDAKISGVYLQKGICKNNHIIERGPPVVCPINQLEEYLKEQPIIVSPNKSRIKPLIEKTWGEHLHWEEVDPNILELSKCGIKELEEGRVATDHHQLELLYLRQTQAEIEKKGRL